MSLSESISLVACAGHLMLAALVLLRGGRNLAKAPLALFLLVFFVWNFATWAFGVSGAPAWHWLDVTFSPWSMPLGLHFVLVFTGRLQAFKRPLVAVYGAFGLLSASSAAAFVLPAARAWIGSSAWSMVYLALMVPSLGLGIAVLLRHLRASHDHDEQLRTRLLLAAIVAAGVLGSTELWDDVFAVPALGHLATLVSTGLMALMVVRFRLFGRDLSSSRVLYAGVLALLAVASYLAIFQWFSTDNALLVIGSVSVTLALVAATRDLRRAGAARRRRLAELAGLGRFAAQLAHDLRNPLAAAKGAAQYLAREHDEGRLGADQGRFVALMEAQLVRLERVIDRYQRLARVEPELAPVEVAALVERVLTGSSLAGVAERGVEVRRELAPELPTLSADADLLASALENLVSNAVDALPQGGALTVSAAVAADGAEALVVRVADDGAGMDARQAQLAFTDFYTTKVAGSGLGLAFVRRIAEAHGGRVRLDTALGRGTVVTLTLPLRRPASAGEGAG